MNAFLQTLRGFYDGKGYALTAAALILAGHCTGLDVVFCAVLVASIFIGCLICTNLRFLIVPVLAFIFIVPTEHGPNQPFYSTYYLETPVLIGIAVMLAVLVGGVITFAVRNRRLASLPTRSGTFWSLVILCAAISLNGLFSPQYTIANFAYSVSFWLSLVGVYLLFGAYVRFDRTAFDYFMFGLNVCGAVILLNLFWAYLTNVQMNGWNPVKETVVTGWGVWTTIGGMLCFLMPAAFYFAASHKRGWIGYLLGVLEFAGIFLSQSRGALVVGAGVLALCVIYLCIKGENRKINRMLTGGFVLLALVLFFAVREKIVALLQNFLNAGFSDNGRFERWRFGVNNFLRAPVFGTGFYDSFYDEGWIHTLYPYLYHNTLIQFLGACGAFGLLAYLWHRLKTIFALFRVPDSRKTFLGLCILGLILFGLIDVLFFNTYPTMYYALMLLFADRINEGKLN